MADTKLTGLTATTSIDGTEIFYVVEDPSGTPLSRKVTGANVRTYMGVNTIYFFPTDNEPPSSNYATLDLRNGHPVLDFDTTTAESAIFTGVFLPNYQGGGITVAVAYSVDTATTGTVGFTVEIERIGDSQLDIDADSYASAQTITAATVPGTTGHVDVISVNISNGANMDSLAAGEQFRVRITRDVANDTAANDAELHWVSIKEQ